MKAIIHPKYGPFEILQYGDVKKPSPGDDQVLVKVHASSINTGNMFAISGIPLLARISTGMLKPKYLNSGSDVAGIVEVVGSKVTRFKAGDAVYGDNLPGGYGTYAEYVCVPEEELALKPSNISFAKAAAVPQAAEVALQGLRDVGQVQSGQKVLITGASGGNGSFAVQIAKALGAEITAVCSPRNIDLVRSLGADKVIDYTQDDFTQDGEKYDLILAMGGYRPLEDYEKALLPGGTYVWAGGDLKGLFETMIKGGRIGRKSKKRLTNLSHKVSREDLEILTELIEAGSVTPLIDRVFPLEEIAEAFSYYKAGHMQGKVIIQVIEED